MKKHAILTSLAIAIIALIPVHLQAQQTQGNQDMSSIFKKLGTLDQFIVEANPIVFKGKPWLMQYIRYFGPGDRKYPGNTLGKSYFRFLSMEDYKTVSAPFGIGLHMGNAFVKDDRIIVTAVEDWGKSKFYQMESEDMVHWTEPRVILEGEGWAGYNTSMCEADGRYILTFELGKPKEMVNVPFTMFFAESTDLKNWKLIPDASFGRDHYTGAPLVRYFNGWFYFIYLNACPEESYRTNIARSRDLKNWEYSKKNPILDFGPEDKIIFPKAQLTDAQKETIAKSKDVNASDLDFCFYNGKLLCSYSWGDQHGHEFLALAEADMTEQQLCESAFQK